MDQNSVQEAYDRHFRVRDLESGLEHMRLAHKLAVEDAERLREEVRQLKKEKYALWAPLHEEFDCRVVVPWGELDEPERLRRSEIIRESWKSFPPTGRRFLKET